MKPFRLGTTLVVFVAACASTWAYASEQRVPQIGTEANTPVAPATQDATRHDPASKPPLITVGVSDPDTQLILPWFLTDIINAVNSRESGKDLLRDVGNGL